MLTSMDDPQVSRILEKLASARLADPSFEVFGASAHRYAVHAPASVEAVAGFELLHAITLPQAYKRFLLGVGNGGVSHTGSAAGPFYGIYALGTGLDDLSIDPPAVALAKPCLMSPRMSVPDWAALTSRLGLDSDLGDEEHDEAYAALFGGLLPIGSQGCTYLHCLVLNGPFAGRVVNVDQDFSQPPVFAHEPDFLAWYERWLDEVISGDLGRGAAWFGYVPGGPETQLLDGFLTATDPQIAQEFLAGLLSKRRLAAPTLVELAALRTDAAAQRATICQIVCKSDPGMARPLLAELAQRDPLSFFQCLFWYARDEIAQWQTQILSLAGRLQDEETFRFFTHVLEPLAVDRGAVLAPFTRSEDSAIRAQAFYAMGKVADRSRYLDCFIAGLDDPDNHVVRNTLQALAGLKSTALVPSYRTLARRFPVERDYVLSNLDWLLRELGLSRADLVRSDVIPTSEPPARTEIVSTIWRRFMDSIRLR